MPVERKSPCPLCMRDTETAAITSVRVTHGECWKRELERRYYTAPPDSHIRKAIADTLAAIKENEK